MAKLHKALKKKLSDEGGVPGFAPKKKLQKQWMLIQIRNAKEDKGINAQ